MVSRRKRFIKLNKLFDCATEVEYFGIDIDDYV